MNLSPFLSVCLSVCLSLSVASTISVYIVNSEAKGFNYQPFPIQLDPFASQDYVYLPYTTCTVLFDQAIYNNNSPGGRGEICMLVIPVPAWSITWRVCSILWYYIVHIVHHFASADTHCTDCFIVSVRCDSFLYELCETKSLMFKFNLF